ncbi:MAG: hypothetical protein LBT91_02680 [Bifidobacteriaceae bacterium]|jgi:hypothetical protein|nr:hypothetical protein [Bifidobacteriaceae bacterium]
MRYKVLATEYGLNYNNEFIENSALNTFSVAFPTGNVSNFGHKASVEDYVPQVGIIEDSYVEDNKGYAIIDFNNEVSAELENGTQFNLSIYSKCKSHIGDENIRVIDEFIYDPDNSIDIVKAGAAPRAKVLEVADNKKDFILCSVKGNFERIQNEEKDNKPVADKVATSERNNTMNQEDVDKISNATAKVVVDALKTVADEKASENQSVEDAAKAETEKQNIVNAKIAEAFKLGATSDLNSKSVEKIANQINLDTDIEKLVADEKEYVSAIADELKKENENEEISSGLKIPSNESSSKYNFLDNKLASVLEKGAK